MTMVAAESGAISDDWQDVGDVESVKSLPINDDEAVKTPPKDATAATTTATTTTSAVVADEAPVTKPENSNTATEVQQPKEAPRAWTSASSTQAVLQANTQQPAKTQSTPTTPAPIRRVMRTLAAYKEALLELKGQLGETVVILDALADAGGAFNTDLRDTLETLKQQTAALSQTIYLSTRLYDAQNSNSRESTVPVNASLGDWLSNALRQTEAAKNELQATENNDIGTPASELLVLSMTMEEFLPVFQAEFELYRQEMQENVPVARPARQNPIPDITKLRAALTGAKDNLYSVSEVLRTVLPSALDESEHRGAMVEMACSNADALMSLITVVLATYAGEWVTCYHIASAPDAISFNEFAQLDSSVVQDVNDHLEDFLKKLTPKVDNPAADVLLGHRYVMLFESKQLDKVLATLGLLQAILIPGGRDEQQQQ